MFRNVIIATCFFYLPIPLCTAQDHGEEIFTAVVKSIEALEKTFLESFELEISRTQNNKSEPIFKFGNSSDYESETIRACRVLKFKENEEFILSSSSGYNGLTIKSEEEIREGDAKPGEQVDYEETSDSYFIYSKNEQTITGRLSRDGVSIDQSNVLEKLDYAFALEDGCKFPITQLSEHRSAVTNFLDPLINFCSERQNQDRIIKTVEDSKEGKVIIFRIKHHPDPSQLFAQKIVVSDEGFDKGLIRENQIGILKGSQYNLPYTSEKQLTSEFTQNVKIKWKEVVLGANQPTRLVVPDRVAKSSKGIGATVTTKSDITQFNWKPLSEEAKKKISLEEAKKTTEEQLKTINKMLKR